MSRIPKYADEAIFPQPHRMPLTMNVVREVILPAQWGLTKREFFAAMAMQGLAPAYAQGGDAMASHVAKLAVENADALLAALAKR